MKTFRVLTVLAIMSLVVASAEAQRGGGAVNKGPKVAPAGQRAGKPAPVTQGKSTGVPQGKADRVRADQAHQGNQDARTPRDTDIAANIARNPQQKTRLEAMLPSGMTLEQGAAGFRNQGQFIAALETSKNQNISFTALKAEMTGANALSLGQAIEKLKPSTTTVAR